MKIKSGYIPKRLAVAATALVTLFFMGCSAATVRDLPFNLRHGDQGQNSAGTTGEGQDEGLGTDSQDSAFGPGGTRGGHLNNTTQITPGFETEDIQKYDLPRMRFSQQHPATPQFNKQDYESFEPTKDMDFKVIEGFYMPDIAEFVPQSSRILKGDRFETYDLAFRVSSDTDYKELLQLFSDNLKGKFNRKDWTTAAGSATYFRIETPAWNKVISIYNLDGQPYYNIRLTYHVLHAG